MRLQDNWVSDDYLGFGKAFEALEKGTRELREVAKIYLEPIAKEKGAQRADKIRAERTIQAIKTLKEADRLLEEAGVRHRSLNLKIAIPLLEYASLETEEELTIKWAGLLASSVSGLKPHASFPNILAELTSTEVKILDLLWKWKEDWAKKGTWKPSEYTIIKLREALSISREDFRVPAENMLRLRLCRLDVFWSEDAAFDREDEVHLQLTALGESFIMACQGPK